MGAEGLVEGEGGSISWMGGEGVEGGRGDCVRRSRLRGRGSRGRVRGFRDRENPLFVEGGGGWRCGEMGFILFVIEFDG